MMATEQCGFEARLPKDSEWGMACSRKAMARS
jgi:hypothetical protein